MTTTLGQLIEELDNDNMTYSPNQMAEIIQNSEWFFTILENARLDAYDSGKSCGEVIGFDAGFVAGFDEALTKNQKIDGW